MPAQSKENPRKKKEQEESKPSVEQLQKKLYQLGTTGVKIKGRSKLQPQRVDAPEGWEGNKENTMKKPNKKRRLSRFSVAQKIFFVSFLVFLFSAGFAFLTFYHNKNTISSKNIELEFEHLAFVDGGEELKVMIDVTNRNHAPLQFTNFILEYPSVTALNENGVARQTQDLDTILPGETKTAEFSVVLYGEQGVQEELVGILQYRVEGSNAIFEKKEPSLITLRSTPVDILVEARDQVITNQQETYKFTVISQSKEPLSNLVLQLDFPPGFEIESTDPTSVFGNDIWTLGTLDPLEEKTITVVGTMFGQEGQTKTIRAYVGSGTGELGGGIATVFNSLNKTVDLVQPFLLAEIFVNRVTDDVVSVRAGASVSASIEWRNTLDEAIKSPELFVELGGPAYDREEVEPQSGFFSSSENKIIWSKETLDALRVVEPGESGSVRFSFTPRLLSGGFSSPEVVLRAGVRGVDSTGQLREASQTDTMRVQVGTVIDLLAETFHDSGPIRNTGSLPPRVGRETSYTVRWTVTNSSNTVERARVTATLPPYITWGGQVSPTNENIRYEPNSRTIVWDLGELRSGAGFSGSGRTAYFQVVITPSLSQLGESPQLTSRVSLSGIDTFTGAELTSETRAPSTRLLNDPGVSTQAASGRIEE